MNHCQAAELPPLPRTSKTTDFSKFFHRRQTSRKSSSRHSIATQASENDSENSQIIYMASNERKRRNRYNRSLSSISNGSGRRLDGSSDDKPYVRDINAAVEELSINIIDREIFEWQYVCKTGLPYWWSPESKYTRLKKIQPRLGNEPSPRIWMREIDDRPQPMYEARRRAVSDSYLSDPTTVHDLAHLVAIQLLGACFTLPPDYVIGVPSPDYTSLGGKGALHSPDPRMISSLRMHTNFRYSPSFGHQARNSSPVQVWPGTYDGSPGSSPLQSPEESTPDLNMDKASRRSRHHRALNVTEDSSYPSNMDQDNRDVLDSASVAKAWYRNQWRSDFSSKPQQSRSSGGKVSKKRHSFSHPYSNDLDASGTFQTLQSTTAQKTNYTLQPIIRSEPHHVFVQPVRELAVKRWKSFRRRFSGSLHAPLPTRTFEDQRSDSGGSGASSPTPDHDAKIRRLRAQERGDIHSSSVDSTQHFNSPASRRTPNESEANTLQWIDSAKQTPTFQLADPLVAAASLVAAETGITVKDFSSGIPSASSPLDSRVQRFSPSSSILASCGTSHSKFEFSSASKGNSPTSSYSYSTRRTSNHRRRRSMLSEVCTPEDFPSPRSGIVEADGEPVDRSILSAVGSTLASPMEEGTWPGWMTASTRSSDSPGSFTMGFRAQLMAQRPSMTRTSTSGTQVFTPRSDGMELDGLPVGPPSEVWVEKGQRREKTYL